MSPRKKNILCSSVGRDPLSDCLVLVNLIQFCSKFLIIAYFKRIKFTKIKRGQNIRLELQRIFDIDIDLLVYTESEINEWSNVEFSFVHTVLKKGKVLYER